MKTLKAENVKKCFSLLREFIEEAPLKNTKETAILALNQLQKIAAGSDPGDGSGTIIQGPVCQTKPRADL